MYGGIIKTSKGLENMNFFDTIAIGKKFMTKTKCKTVTGELINFRGLVWAPGNEQGVVFLFGMISRELGMYVELIRPGYPDCIAKRYIGKGRWEEVRIEFEYCSSHFKHDPSEFDMIVCWEHDWKECPKSIEIIELKGEIKRLENFPLEPPDKQTAEEKYSTDIANAISVLKRSHQMIDQCIKDNVPTGWYAEVE